MKILLWLSLLGFLVPVIAHNEANGGDGMIFSGPNSEGVEGDNFVIQGGGFAPPVINAYKKKWNAYSWLSFY